MAEVVKEKRTHVTLFLHEREYVDGRVGVVLVAYVLGKEYALTEEQQTEADVLRAWRGKGSG